MKSTSQKLKILCLMKIFLEKTDEEHPLTVPQLITELARYDISAERKSIYDDIETLKLFGLDICSRKSKTTDYFVGSRDFELPELKILVDSVQSSKFITKKKSMELIKKIEKMTSESNAKKLHRQVYVENRVKARNEKIYYNVDKIDDAIASNKKIVFKYFDLDINKNKIYRKNGDTYEETPISMTWDYENYYLITYKEKYNKYLHYRVDKMDDIETIDKNRVLPKESFDLSSYVRKMFQMYNGEEVDVVLEFDKDLVGVVFDRFGTEIFISKEYDNKFVFNIKVSESPQFLSWVASFGSKAKILYPESTIERFKELLLDSLTNY